MNAVRFSIAIVRLVVCTTIAPILLSTGTGSALAANSGPEKFSYDPSTCKTDAHGKLYIALGRNVLALPSSGAIIVARYGNDWLTPPDPTDSVGCPNNPEQLTGFGFPYAYNTAAGKENTPFPATHAARLDLLQLISIHGYRDVPPGAATSWAGEDLETKIAKVVCETASIHEDLPSGLSVCRFGPKDSSSMRLEDWTATYVGRSEVYETPLGHPFIVNCGPWTYSTGIGHCDVSYVFSPGMGVTYRFRPYHGLPPRLSVDQVVEFDRGLRAAISNALVKDYTWPEQPPHPKSN